MANLSITNSFTSGTTIVSADVNTNFTDISTWLNGRDNGTASWLNVSVLGTAANLVKISSSAATTELSIDNTATDGDPIITWKLGGTTKFSAGVDDGDSDAWKLGSTAIGTGTTIRIPAGGDSVEFPDGDTTNCAIGNIGDPDTGLVWSAANTLQTVAGGNVQMAISDGSILFSPSGTSKVSISSTHLRPSTNDDVSCGDASFKWSDLQSVLINGSDYGFANGYVLREYPCTSEDIHTKSNAWMKKHANKGIQILNDKKKLICVIGRNGTIYAKAYKSLDDLK